MLRKTIGSLPYFFLKLRRRGSRLFGRKSRNRPAYYVIMLESVGMGDPKVNFEGFPKMVKVVQ